MPERAIRDAGNEMIRKDGTLVCSDGGFYLKNSFRAELGAAASLVKLILRGGTQSYQVDSIISSIQKKEKILLNAMAKRRILRCISISGYHHYRRTWTWKDNRHQLYH